MFKKNSNFYVKVVDSMSDTDLEELNFPIITVTVGIWSNIVW